MTVLNKAKRPNRDKVLFDTMVIENQGLGGMKLMKGNAAKIHFCSVLLTVL